MLACLGLLVFFEIAALGLAEYTFQLGVGLDSGAPHLHSDELAGQSHFADVMSGRCLYSDNVAGREIKMSCIAEESLSGVFELHFHKLVVSHASRDVGQPVVAVEFTPRRFLAACRRLSGSSGLGIG